MNWLSSWLWGSGANAGREPTPTEVEVLRSLVALLRTPFAEDNPEHEALLQRLWVLAFGSQDPYQKKGKGWRRLGFQREDPRSDFRGGGLLGLHCLMHFFETQRDEALRMIQIHSARTEYNYPWAALSINITHLVADVCQLKSGGADKFVTHRSNGWPLVASQPRAFYDLYVLTFRFFEQTWQQRRARYMDSPQIMEFTKQTMRDALEKAPADLAALAALLPLAPATRTL